MRSSRFLKCPVIAISLFIALFALAPGALHAQDELSKEGDDFAVRVYFLAPGAGWLSFPDSVVYVWASRQPAGSAWPNPYTKKAHMVAVDSGAAHAGQWRAHRRNMRKDFKRYFGRDITEITHIAIMTDTDNSKLSARGWYGDIRVAPAGP